MDSALAELIESPYTSMPDVVRSFTALEDYWIQRRDRRSVFLSAYNTISKAIAAGVDGGTFHDPAWTERYGVTFAELYRQSLVAFESGSGVLPTAWRISFQESKAGRLLVMQDLVLGIHAHVNHDLAWALAGLGIDPNRAARLHDHTAVNAILDRTTDALQARLAQLYARGLGTMDALLGRMDESFSSVAVRLARQHAWTNAVSLVDGDAEAREAIGRRIDANTATLANLVLRPNVRAPWIIEAAHGIEELLGWVDVLRPPAVRAAQENS
jgi:hypothetical protein